MSNEPKPRKFKILSIDGGGIKGLYSSKIIERFEEHFKCRISEKFDMICGTSTGGLIALGLSLDIPAAKLVNFYIDKGPKIFPKRGKYYGKWRQIFWKGKYDNKELRKALEKIFEDHRLNESSVALCIPSYSLTEGRPWVFKYGTSTKLTRDDNVKYVDVAMATSAAPTFLPIHKIDHYNNRQFIDGGIWGNNPTLCGLIEGLTYFLDSELYDELEILSISSLEKITGEQVDLKSKRAFFNWQDELFECSMHGQNEFTHYFMTKIHEITTVPVRYVRIPSMNVSSKQESLVQLDITTKKALDLFMAKANDQADIYLKKECIVDFFKHD